MKYIEAAIKLYKTLVQIVEFAEKSAIRRVSAFTCICVLSGSGAVALARYWNYNEINTMRDSETKASIHEQEAISNSATEKLSLCAQELTANSKLKDEYCNEAKADAIKAARWLKIEERTNKYLEKDGYLMAAAIIKQSLSNAILDTETRANSERLKSYFDTMDKIPYIIGFSIPLSVSPFYILVWIRHRKRATARWQDKL